MLIDMKTLFATLWCIALAFPTFAQESLLKAGSSKGPIEITADNLEVRQAEHIAVFSGNVIAVQGQLKLKAERMTVHYREGANTEAGQESISKIEVDGNVFLSNPSETAQGDKGIYDVDANEIRLQNNVVLTRQDNILKGETLVYNLGTGKSTMTNAGATTENGKPARVRALFTPGSATKPGVQ